jgi:aminopeptidase-like protein
MSTQENLAETISKQINEIDFNFLVEQAFDTVFDICRAVVSKGNQETIDHLKSIFEVGEFQKEHFCSGSKLGTWTVPNEWNLVSYSLMSTDGELLQDIQDTNLRVVYGSNSFVGEVKMPELLKRTYTHPTEKEAVPFVTNYYGDFDWGVCMSETEKINLMSNHESVIVNINVEKVPGNLVIWSRILGYEKVQNLNKKRILFWSYNCHPQMAQNELSGPITMFFLIKIMEMVEKGGYKFRYAYDFSISSETIGAIGKILSIEDALNNYLACHVLTCIGVNSSKLSVQESIDGTSYATCVIKTAVRDKVGSDYCLNDFNMRGSDERQFMWPGVDIDTSYFCTKKYHQFKEYHTNLDNMLDVDAIIKSVQIYLDAILIHETNTIVQSASVGEPMLSKFGRWPEVNVGGRLPEKYRQTDFLVLCDGNRSLLQISEILNWPYSIVLKLCDHFTALGLLKVPVGR